MTIPGALRISLKAILFLAVMLASPDAHARCPRGFFRDRFGRCVPAVVAPRVCPPGYFYFRGRCVHR